MKGSPDHLPQWKQDELARVVGVILEASEDVAMVILFGSYARGDYKEVADLAADRKSGHVSDYDILVIAGQGKTTYDSVLWQDAELECWRLGLSARAKIIAHDIDFVNSRLAEGQYFFKDIKREGCLLYDSGDFSLAQEKRLTREEKKRIAQEHFDHWFERAGVFLEDYQLNRDKSAGRRKYLNQAAFHLHQSAEAAYKTILLVLTNYCPHEHFLGMLGLMAEEQDASLRGIFPQQTKADRQCFKQFDYAYIGARYDPKYKISAKDLDYFAERVCRLLELTEKICQKRLGRLAASNGFADG